MRVLTLNLFARHAGWEARRDVLAEGLRALAPDLVALQEAVVSGGYDQARDVLGDGYHVHHQRGRAPDGSGATIASRWPFAAVHERDLHVSARLDPAHGWIGSVAAVEVASPAPIGAVLFVHHKPAWQLPYERERELQAVSTARFVEELVGGRDLHVVLAGDLDAPPEAASIRFLAGLQSLDGVSVAFRDAWTVARGREPGHTLSPRNELVRAGEMPLEPGRRIDYVLVRCRDHGPTLEVAACSLAFAEAVDGVWASDHFGVVADLRAPAAPEPAVRGAPSAERRDS